MWFKSDLSIYQRADFRHARKKCNAVSTLWEWIQRESILQESADVKIRSKLHLDAILEEELFISEGEFNQALSLLGDLELVIFDDWKKITLPNWLENQGMYFAKKQAEALRKAEYRNKQKQQNEKYVPGTEQGQDKDVHGKSDIREEEIREEESRKEKSRVEENINTGGSQARTSDPKKRFTPPTEQEIQQYLLDENKVSTQEQAKKYSAAIWGYYESNGWKVGKNPMKNWHAAVSGWIARDSARASPARKGARGEQVSAEFEARSKENGTKFNQFMREVGFI